MKSQLTEVDIVVFFEDKIIYKHKDKEESKKIIKKLNGNIRKYIQELPVRCFIL